MAETTENTVYFTEREVAEMTRLSRNTLAMWRWKRRGPPHVKFGKAVRYSEAGLRAWIEANGASARALNGDA